jgi:hypothetical protein
MTVSAGCSELTAQFIRRYDSRCGVHNDYVFANTVFLYQKVTFSQLYLCLHMQQVHTIFVQFWLI